MREIRDGRDITPETAGQEDQFPKRVFIPDIKLSIQGRRAMQGLPEQNTEPTNPPSETKTPPSKETSE